MQKNMYIKISIGKKKDVCRGNIYKREEGKRSLSRGFLRGHKHLKKVNRASSDQGWKKYA